MKKNFVVLILVVSGLVVFAGCNTPADTEVTDQEVVAPQLKGPYLGQKLPGDEAEIFAEGIVTNRMMNRDIAVSKDGNEIYFSIGSNRFATIAVSRQVDGIWSQPEVLPFATDPKFAYMEPALSHDDQRLYFLSNRNPEGQEPGRGWAHQHIWYSERGEDGVWGEMKELGSPINGEEHDYFPSFTDDGTMYYTWSKKGQG